MTEFRIDPTEHSTTQTTALDSIYQSWKRKMRNNFFTQWKRWLGWATKKKPKKKKIVAAITSLVQSEVVEVESILLVKLFQLEAKNQVSLSEEILNVYF